MLVLAGDITAAEARPLVEKYFGDIPRGTQVHSSGSGCADAEGAGHARSSTTRSPTPTIYRMWAVPGVTGKDTTALDMAASVLGGLASSRLDNALVRDKKTAVGVSADVDPHERVGEFTIEATVKPGVDPALVGKQLDADHRRLHQERADRRRAEARQDAATSRERSAASNRSAASAARR